MKKLLCILCVCPGLLCQAGTVRLLNGDSLNGKVTLGTNGVAVAPEHAPATTVDLTNLFSANFTERPASEVGSLPPGVVLTNGAFIPGEVRAFDEPTLKLGTQARPYTVPRESVAAIVLGVTPRAAIYRPPSGKTGAILPNGDFFAGTFTGFQKTAVVVNSLLFGPHPFQIPSQISAVVLRDIQVPAARYEIGARDGSRFFTNEAAVTRDGLSIRDFAFGPMKIAPGDLAEIRAGRGCFEPLSDMKPVAAANAAGADASSSVSTSEDPETGSTLSSGANIAVTYAVPPGLGVFTASVAVPADAPQAARVTFALYCDGRFIVRSAQIAPGANPQPLRVNCGAAQRLTLRVEPATPGSDAVVGRWTGAMFLRP